MKTIRTPIGYGVLVGRIVHKDASPQLLVMYSHRVLEAQVTAGYTKYLPYCGGPTVLFAWDEGEVTP